MLFRKKNLFFLIVSLFASTNYLVAKNVVLLDEEGLLLLKKSFLSRWWTQDDYHINEAIMDDINIILNSNVKIALFQPHNTNGTYCDVITKLNNLPTKYKKSTLYTKNNDIVILPRSESFTARNPFKATFTLYNKINTIRTLLANNDFPQDEQKIYFVSKNKQLVDTLANAIRDSNLERIFVPIHLENVRQLAVTLYTIGLNIEYTSLADHVAQIALFLFGLGYVFHRLTN